MKLLYILMACLCTASAFSQANGTEAGTSSDGYYSFSKATVTIYNYDTRAEVLTQAFNDTTSLTELNRLPVLIQPVFLSVTIQKGVLTLCKLWNNREEYSIQEDGRLLVPLKPSADRPEAFDIFSQGYSLPQGYTLEMSGNTVTFTFTQPYGSSAYSFSLEEKLVITLVKNEPTKTE